MKSMAGLYSNYSGKLTYKDTEVSSFSSNDYCTKVIYVSSEHNFILPSLKDELFTHASINEGQVNDLLSAFMLETLIRELPRGLDTACSDIHSVLNVGSVQKLRILRAVSRNPSYLLLDEMFANIEEEQCMNILNAIFEMFPAMTVVIVEHHVRLPIAYDRRLKLTGSKVISEVRR